MRAKRDALAFTLGSIKYDIRHSPVNCRGKSKDAGDNQQPWQVLKHRSTALGSAR
jgi:hypothetical protein